MPYAVGDYIGRFAPSPSGPLHFGSLVAALASFLDARTHGGLWLLRIEDLDPPREIAGAAQQIIQSLRDHSLVWDGEICWQSQRHYTYRAALEQLQRADRCYYCDCSRAMLAVNAGIYQGHCRQRGLAGDSGCACRIRVDEQTIAFDDIFQGHQSQRLDREVGDFVLKRKDGLFAYQLAVVVDDAWQGINHVIRGTDLLDSTERQIYLQQQLGLATPVYGHIPLATNAEGQKLSKQNLAPAIDSRSALDNLRDALAFLGQAPPPAACANPGQLLAWAIPHWRRENVVAPSIKPT